MDKDIRELSGILDSLGVDESAELVSGLNIVNYLGHADGLQLLAAGERQPLGQLLLAAKRLSKAQLEDALSEQRSSGRMLGEILMQRGVLDAGGHRPSEVLGLVPIERHVRHELAEPYPER